MSERATVRGLLEGAATFLRWAELARSGARFGVDERGADDEREAIAVAARGLLPVARLDAVSVDLFIGAPRLLAWLCACRAARASGRGATFFGARYVLTTAPRLEMPRAVWEELVREAEEEIDASERIDRPSAAALGRLQARSKAQRARAFLGPALESLDRGEVAGDVAERLRAAADLLEDVGDGRRGR